MDIFQFRFLNIGGGNFQERKDGWANLDFRFDALERKRNWEAIDVHHNLMTKKPIPIADRSLQAVYSEHTIEHFPDDVVEFVFSEAYRILEAKCILRVSVPNAEQIYRIVKQEDPYMQQYLPHSWWKGSPQQTLLDVVASPIVGKISDDEVRQMMNDMPMEDVLDKFTRMVSETTIEEQTRRPGRHLSWWNAPKLIRLMEKVGFTDVVCNERKESRNRYLRYHYIDNTAPNFSVRVEGIR